MLKYKPLRIFLMLTISFLFGYSVLLLVLGNEGRDNLQHQVGKDILLRRNFLIHTIATKNSPDDFFGPGQAQYMGEWTLGTFSMTSAALANIAMLKPDTAKESSEAIAKLIEMSLQKNVQYFDEIAWNESPLDEKVLTNDEGHIGYYGHLNLMLGCYALLNNDGRFKNLHAAVSEAIARRMKKYPHRHIQTYPNETYPPDNTVAAASLRVSDMTLNTNYKSLVDEWVTESRKLEYKKNGLIVFQIDITTGIPLQTSRGSNTAWNSFFLPLVDENYAAEQFSKYKKNMLKRIPGFAAFKEYPDGGLFRMDCDTGPVIFGLGASATGLAVAGARWSKDEKLLSELLRSVELIGVSMQRGNEKRYVASPIVGDAIMLAMKTVGPWRPLWKN